MNRDAHLLVGAAAAFVDLATTESPQAETAAEIVGRIAGGLLGGRAPDMIDPPTHPGHRGIGHAIVPAIAVFALVARQMPGWQTTLREHATNVRFAAEVRPASERWPLQLEAVASEFLLGLIAGIPAGYASHLVLDASTPAGLPLFARGC